MCGSSIFQPPCESLHFYQGTSFFLGLGASFFVCFVLFCFVPCEYVEFAQFLCVCFTVLECTNYFKTKCKPNTGPPLWNFCLFFDFNSKIHTFLVIFYCLVNIFNRFLSFLNCSSWKSYFFQTILLLLQEI